MWQRWRVLCCMYFATMTSRGKEKRRERVATRPFVPSIPREGASRGLGPVGRGAGRWVGTALALSLGGMRGSGAWAQLRSRPTWMVLGRRHRPPRDPGQARQGAGSGCPGWHPGGAECQAVGGLLLSRRSPGCGHTAPGRSPRDWCRARWPRGPPGACRDWGWGKGLGGHSRAQPGAAPAAKHPSGWSACRSGDRWEGRGQEPLSFATPGPQP